MRSLLLLVHLAAILAFLTTSASIDLGPGVTLLTNGLGMQFTAGDVGYPDHHTTLISSSTYTAQLTCLHELNGSSAVVQSVPLSNAAMTINDKGNDGTGYAVEVNLSWTEPFTGSAQFQYKHWEVAQTISPSVPGANDSVFLLPGDLKGYYIINWSPLNYANTLQVCFQVSWDNTVTVTDETEQVTPSINYSNMKNAYGTVIGIEVTTDWGYQNGWEYLKPDHFYFYWPGHVLYHHQEGESNSTYLGDGPSVSTASFNNNPQGSIQVTVNFDSIGDVIEVDPVLVLSAGSLLQLYLSVLTLVLLGFILSTLV